MFDVIRSIRSSTTIALVLSPVGVLIIAVTRLLIVSDYNPATASAIVTSTGYVNALLGTVIPLVPIFLPYVGLTLLFSRRFTLGVLALLVAALISPAIVGKAGGLGLAERDWDQIWSWVHSSVGISVGLGVLAVLTLVSLIALTGFGMGAVARSAGVILSLPVAVYVLRIFPFPFTDTYYTELIRQPWLPAQSVSYPGHGTVVGYSLSGDGESMEFLQDDDRRIIFIPETAITSEQICQITRVAAVRPLITLAPSITQIPLCRPARPQSPGAPPVIPVDGRQD
jgi:hypothetical protein